MRWKTILANAATVAVSTVVALLPAEIVVRVVAPQGVLLSWDDDVDGVRAPRAGVKGRHSIRGSFDVTVAVSPQRFRGERVYEPEADAGVLRIACLGDSHCFGFGVPDDETYPVHLERELKERRIRGGCIEVINAGTNGTGTGDQVLWFDTWVSRFHPSVVILAFRDNDVDDDLARGLFVLNADGTASPRPAAEIAATDRRLRSFRRWARATPFYDYLGQHSALMNLLSIRVSVLLSNPSRAAPAGAAQAEDDAFEKRGLPIMAGELAWLAARVGERGGRLAVVFVPSRELVYASDAPWATRIRARSDRIVPQARGTAERIGVPFRDLTPEIQREAERSAEPLFNEGVDNHPRPAGYRAIARAIAAFLTESGVVPPP